MDYYRTFKQNPAIMKKLYSLILFTLLAITAYSQSTCTGGLLGNYRFANGFSGWSTYGPNGAVGPVNTTASCLDTFAQLPATNASTSGIRRNAAFQQDSCYNLCYCVGALPSNTIGNVLYLVGYSGAITPAQIISGSYTTAQAQVLDSLVITGALAPITICKTFTATAAFTGFAVFNQTLGTVGLDVNVDNICIQQFTCPPIYYCDSLSAGFTSSGTGATFNFTDQTIASPGNVFSWSWDFGDPASGPNNTSSLQNPTHTFSGPGTYNVCLIVSGGVVGVVCFDTICQTVTIANPCDSLNANFSFTGTGTNYSFTDLSTIGIGGSIVSWAWDFGDPASGANNTSNLQNPAHVFTGSGTYNVCLIVGGTVNAAIPPCFDTICQTITIVDPCDSVVPGFTYTNTVLNFNFTNTTTGPVGSTFVYNWDFGDPASGPNNTSNLTSPTHTFTGFGNYTVCLYVQTILASGLTSCRDTICQNIFIPYDCDSLTAAFSTVLSGLTGSFTDLSTAGGVGVISSWSWNFGDPSSGTNDTSTLQNPAHTFTGPGTYTVCLIVGGGMAGTVLSCYDTICQTITVTDPCDSLLAAFTFTGSGLVFNFTHASTMGSGGTITNWSWDFGDPPSGGNNTSNLQNPSHTFSGAGTYNVCLIVFATNAAGTLACHDTICQTITVTDPCDSLQAAFTFTGSGFNYNFTDASTIGAGGVISSWQWDFGDPASGPNNTSNLPNPVHAFTGAGTYNVCLIVGGGIPGSVISCYDTICQTITVSDPCDSLVANFSFTNVGNVFTFTDLSTFTGGAITAWQWNFGDPPSGPANTSNLQNPTHTFTSPGPHTVCLQVLGGTAGAQCRDTICITVNVPPPPVPCDSLQASFTQTCTGLTCNFTDGSTFPGGAISAWAWDFGDPPSGANNTSSLQNPSHTFTAPGVYFVCLIVTGNSGSVICKDTFCIDVTVYAPGIHELSNATVIIVPNPTRDNFTINTAVEIDRYALTDITGRIVTEEKFTNPVITFPGTCEGGVYLLSLYTRDNKLLVKRVVLQR